MTSWTIHVQQRNCYTCAWQFICYSEFAFWLLRSRFLQLNCFLVCLLQTLCVCHQDGTEVGQARGADELRKAACLHKLQPVNMRTVFSSLKYFWSPLNNFIGILGLREPADRKVKHYGKSLEILYCCFCYSTIFTSFSDITTLNITIKQTIFTTIALCHVFLLHF